MSQRITRFLLIAMLFSSMGAHLAVLQTVAWAKMVMTFSRSENLNTSLQKTFDGRHPCAMCLKVKKAAQSTASSLGASRNENPQEGILLESTPQITRIDTTWSLSMVFSSLNNYVVIPDSPPPKDILS